MRKFLCDFNPQVKGSKNRADAKSVFVQNKEYLFEAHELLIQDVNFVEQFTKFLTFTKCNNKYLSNILYDIKSIYIRAIYTGCL